MQQFPKKLSKEETKALLANLQAGDAFSKEKLIVGNIGLVVAVAKQFKPNASDLDDLISIGMFGLIKAVDSFRFEKGKWSNYAATCIQNEIRNSFRRSKFFRYSIPLDVPIMLDQQSILISEIIPSADPPVEHRIEHQELHNELELLFHLLKPRHRKWVQDYFGWNDEEPKTQRQIEKETGVAQAQISRGIKTSLLQMREYIEKQKR